MVDEAVCMNEVISIYIKNENSKGPRVSRKGKYCLARGQTEEFLGHMVPLFELEDTFTAISPNVIIMNLQMCTVYNVNGTPGAEQCTASPNHT